MTAWERQVFLQVTGKHCLSRHTADGEFQKPERRHLWAKQVFGAGLSLSITRLVVPDKTARHTSAKTQETLEKENRVYYESWRVHGMPGATPQGSR